MQFFVLIYFYEAEIDHNKGCKPILLSLVTHHAKQSAAPCMWDLIHACYNTYMLYFLVPCIVMNP